jgi:hypothetical protein
MKPIHFEIATYLAYIFTVILIAARYRSHRDYWFALIGCTLAFPFEWLADKFWMFLDYDWAFVMLVDRLPLMMPFAWGWFFALPLIICLRFQDRIDALPLVLRVALLYGVFFTWDIVVEYFSTSFLLWDYHWNKEAMIGGLLPWFIPLSVSFANTLLYFAHKIALKKSRDMPWIQGALTHASAYYIVFIIQISIGWSIIKILGIGPVLE